MDENVDDISNIVTLGALDPISREPNFLTAHSHADLAISFLSFLVLAFFAEERPADIFPSAFLCCYPRSQFPWRPMPDMLRVTAR